MAIGELEMIVPRRAVLRAPLLSNTETTKWRKVYVPIAIIRNNGMVKCLSIPIVPNNIIVKGPSIPIFQTNLFGERYIDVPIGQTHRFRLSAPISYRPNNTVLKICVDTYLLYIDRG